MTALAIDVRELDDQEVEMVRGGVGIGAAIVAGLVIVAAETVVVPFIKGMYEGFTDDK